MKKYLFIILILFLLIIKIQNKEKIEETFNEITKDENTHEFFYIKIKEGFNSKEINTILNENIKIIAIYPNLDKMIDKKLKEKLEYYSCSPIISNKENINRFINNYIQTLKNNNYNEEANKIYNEGIKVKKILIYTSYNLIYDLKEKNKNIIVQTIEI